MSSRSLKVASKNINEVKKQLKICGFPSQKAFAIELGMSRTTISNFLNGKKGIDYLNFVEICEKLDLDWQKIVDFSEGNLSQSDNSKPEINIDSSVKKVRDKIRPYILEKCGTMQVLDMTHPIGLGEIYTDVNILQKITSRRRLNLSELQNLYNLNSENFDRPGLGLVSQERVPGLVAVKGNPKLMIWGKPGAGKTTFLKYLAIQSLENNVLDNRIPIFITLKDFAETNNKSLIDYINAILRDYGVSKKQVIKLFKSGSLLILLDGLDEVNQNDTRKIIKQVKQLSHLYYFSDFFKEDQINYIREKKEGANLIIKKQNNELEQVKHQQELDLNLLINEFIEQQRKELEDFKVEHFDACDDEKKIFAFQEAQKKSLEKYKKDIAQKNISNQKRIINKWNIELDYFNKEYPDFTAMPDQGLQFLSNKHPNRNYVNYFVITCRIAAKETTFEGFREVEVADFDYKQIQTFAHNWFELKNPQKEKAFIQKLSRNQPIQELASNPLLLTLLCLVFEESTDFPLNRSELYREGTDILLQKWDGKRNIERDKIYKNLSKNRKEDLLARIAFQTFDKGEYFFKQQVAEDLIASYIYNLPDAQIDSTALQLDSEAILQSIEEQHGLLVERATGIYSFSHLTFQEYFTARETVTTSDPQQLEISLQKLASHITEKRWREVFLLAVEMLRSADRFLLLIKNEIEQIISQEKYLEQMLLFFNSKSIISEIESIDLSSISELCSNHIKLYKKYNWECRRIITSVTSDTYFDNQVILHLESIFNRLLDLNNSNLSILNPQLISCLLQLKDEIPVLIKTNKLEYIENHKNEVKQWIELFKKSIKDFGLIENHNHINDNFLTIFTRYYNANRLLLECMNSNCYMSRKIRLEIKKNLFLPVSKTEIC